MREAVGQCFPKCANVRIKCRAMNANETWLLRMCATVLNHIRPTLRKSRSLSRWQRRVLKWGHKHEADPYRESASESSDRQRPC